MLQRNACLAALFLAYSVVVLGAYTRLSDAGLGCPDWPGCYGKLVVPEAADAARANALYPDRPLQHGKAWREMIHRYAAGTLGLLILLLAALNLRDRLRAATGARVSSLPAVLLGLVVFQAALGMWTVTWLLKPIVVTAHLLGGLTILALLFWLALGRPPAGSARLPTGLERWAAAAIAVLAVQIFLGGWTSANYAALVCPEFPMCRGGAWWPAPDFREGFVFWRGLGRSYQYGVLDAPARTAIHLAHRCGALLAAIVIGTVALRALGAPDVRTRRIGLAALLLLVLQISLGVANVLLLLPLPVAVAHNATAALLLLSLVALLHRAVQSRR